LWSHHHILLDGWSSRLVLKDTLAAYGALRRGRMPALAPSPPFHDFIAWLRRRDPEAARAFWRRQLAGFRSPTELPGERRAAQRRLLPDTGASGQVERVKHERRLPRSVTADLQEMARRSGVTLSTLAKGAWALLLTHWSGSRDVVFGEVVAG